MIKIAEIFSGSWSVQAGRTKKTRMVVGTINKLSKSEYVFVPFPSWMEKEIETKKFSSFKEITMQLSMISSL